MDATDEEIVDRFEERAGIRQYMAGIDVARAEYLALRDVRQIFGRVPQSIVDRVKERRQAESMDQQRLF